MNKFDQIYGYATVKKDLQRIADVLKNSEKYAKLGVSAPRGLLLFGPPGVGKSLMAEALIEASGRTAFTCRKNQPDGKFVREIKEVFDKAVANAPSIVLLDDMDKFANGDEDRPDAEEYVTVQSCIDAVKHKDVFVIATVNNMRCLPTSLCRAGRFDRKIRIKEPVGKDAEEIIGHYLKNKKVEGVDAKTIASLMDGRSCAELETIINEAGLYAAYDHAEAITIEYFLEAFMRKAFDALPADCDDGEISLCGHDNHAAQVVYHEAGHAVAFEVLTPGCVSLAAVSKRGGRYEGFVSHCDDYTCLPYRLEQSRVVGALAGMAAVELQFGSVDIGAESDLDQVFRRVRSLVKDLGVCGLHLRRCSFDDSETLCAAQEKAIAHEVERYFKLAKEILTKNRAFFEKTAQALAKKRVLTAADIREIKRECPPVSVAL